MREPTGERVFVRFHPLRRIEHLLTLTCFFMLVITGLPQKFHMNPWAVPVVDFFGGIGATRALHRFFGLLMSIQFSIHLAYAFWYIWIKRGPLTMVPNWQDVKDAILYFRYTLRKTDEHPRYGRFDYKQKFEYWGMIVGGLVMINTGWVLWKPTLITAFLPADLIPISRVAHSNEAFLAFMVILFWHIYSVTLNPEVFPLDTTIFTGKMSEHRMKHEHPLEYERLMRETESSKDQDSPS